MFHHSHQLTLAIYRHTRLFPKDEWFGLRAQLRRAAVSIPSNIVEGSARRTPREYFSFLNIARGSAAELKYLVGLASELDLLSKPGQLDLAPAVDRVVAELEVLVKQVERLANYRSLRSEAVPPEARSLKPEARSLTPEA